VLQSVCHLGLRSALDSEKPAQGVTQGPIGVVGAVGFALNPEHGDVGISERFFDEPRLSHPGLADHDHTALVSLVHLGDCASDRFEFPLPASEGKRRVRVGGAGPRFLTNGVRLHRLGFPFHVEGFERRGDEEGPGPVEHAGSRVDLSGRRGSHETGRQVHRVAHHRVRAAERSTDLAGEDMTPIHADLERQGGAPVGDGPNRPQHPTLVVLLCDRSPCRQDDLAAVGVDVGCQERDPFGVHGVLNSTDQLGEVLCDEGMTAVAHGGHRFP
jgi:hypothetical protein